MSIYGSYYFGTFIYIQQVPIFWSWFIYTAVVSTPIIWPSVAADPLFYLWNICAVCSCITLALWSLLIWTKSFSSRSNILANMHLPLCCHTLCKHYEQSDLTCIVPLLIEQLKYQVSAFLGKIRPLNWLWCNNWRSLVIHHIPIDGRMLASDLTNYKEWHITW